MVVEDTMTTEPSRPTGSTHPNWHVRQQQGRVVVWGCKEHQMPAGEECQGCADQGELFTRAAVVHASKTKRSR